MIDHLVGTPSPSWKRTQVRFTLISLSNHSSNAHLILSPFPPRFFLLFSSGYGESRGVTRVDLAFSGYGL